MQKPMNNDELKNVLPDLQKEFDVLNSDSFQEYEEKLTIATNKAIKSLENIIDDGTLALDPEQLVNAVKALTKAKSDIMDSRRKLTETLIKGQVMLKALQPPKNENQDNVLLEYLKANNLNTEIADTSSNSIFGEVEKN